MPDLADLLRLAGILLIVFFLFRMQTRRFRRRKLEDRAEERAAALARGQVPTSQHASTAAAAHRLRKADQWEVALEETARNALAEVQTKTMILQQLIVDANAAAERLEAAVTAAERQQREAAL